MTTMEGKIGQDENFRYRGCMLTDRWRCEPDIKKRILWRLIKDYFVRVWIWKWEKIGKVNKIRSALYMHVKRGLWEEKTGWSFRNVIKKRYKGIESCE